MNHLCRHIIESPRVQLDLLALTGQDRFPENHGVRLICSVPMLAHMDRFRRANEQAGSLCFRINMEKTDFWRAFSEIGKNLVPFQIGDILENWSVARRRGRFRCSCTDVAQCREHGRQKNQKRESCFHREPIEPASRFYKKLLLTADCADRPDKILTEGSKVNEVLLWIVGKALLSPPCFLCYLLFKISFD
jgi:hypothetical protein